MIEPVTILTALGALGVVVLVWSERSEPRLRPAAKFASSAGFVLVAVVGGATGSAYGRWVLVALVLSAIGDLLLLGATTRTFLAGLGAFLVAHLAYIGAFAVRGLEPAAAVLALGALTAPALVVVRWLWPHVPHRLRIPVAVYATVITLMVAAAVGTAANLATGTIPLAAIAFYLSDLAVARERFRAPGFVNKLWGLPLYYIAQYVFAWNA